MINQIVPTKKNGTYSAAMSCDNTIIANTSSLSIVEERLVHRPLSDFKILSHHNVDHLLGLGRGVAPTELIERSKYI